MKLLAGTLLLMATSMCWATDFHDIKFYLDPELVDAETPTRLVEYVADMNAVLTKNTTRELKFDPATGVIETTSQPHGGSGGVRPDTDFEIWAHAIKSPLARSYGGSAAADGPTGNGVLASLKWYQVYDPDNLATDAQIKDYWVQIHNMLHELAHVYRAGLGEYYSLLNVNDTTEEPITDIRYSNWTTDVFWGSRNDWLRDPLTLFPYKRVMVGAPDTREELIATAQYADMTAGIISGHYRSQGQGAIQPDKSDIEICVKDTSGQPIGGATVAVWKQRAVPQYQSSLVSETVTDAAGSTSFNWAGGMASNFNNLRLIKVYAAGYQDKVEYVSTYDAHRAKVVDGQDHWVITVEMDSD